MSSVVDILLEVEDTEWSPVWEPSPEILEWFRRFLSRTRPGVWVSPGSGQIYNLNPETKTAILIHGSPYDLKHWHLKNKKVMSMLGWTVLDSPGDKPDQMSFAESISAELLEDASTPFAKTPVTLQYRPFRLNDEWKWYWVLLPEDRSKALASGQADNRAQAAVGARKEARRLKVVIAKIDVLKPYEKR